MNIAESFLAVSLLCRIEKGESYEDTQVTFGMLWIPFFRRMYERMPKGFCDLFDEGCVSKVIWF